MLITDVDVRDIRFPTSRDLDGSDAINVAPDYSATYVTLRTDTGLEGNGITFTTGRGNELCVAAVRALAPLVRGRSLGAITSDFAGFWYEVVGDPQLRWVGPEKGVIHLAAAALINAVWDLYAKAAEKPLWRLLADMAPDELVDCLPLRYLGDALTRDQAVALLAGMEAGKADRERYLLESGYPAYTTSAGWLGYSDDKLTRLTQAALAEGFDHLKLKVGANRGDDVRRALLMRKLIGEHRTLMVDANQIWDVPLAIDWMQALAPARPWFIEEPTSPDDILGHAAIADALAPLGIGVATGEHCHNRVMFKQFLRSGHLTVVQPDACRLGGVNEFLVVLLLAAQAGVPVCPHAGGVGLCEYVQHLSMFDYVAVSGSMDGRVIEYVDHLHEHFVDPVRVRGGRYLAPQLPGYSITMHEESLRQYEFPGGPAWTDPA